VELFGGADVLEPDQSRSRRSSMAARCFEQAHDRCGGSVRTTLGRGVRERDRRPRRGCKIVERAERASSRTREER
jgi:hypothetical protein